MPLFLCWLSSQGPPPVAPPPVPPEGHPGNKHSLWRSTAAPEPETSVKPESTAFIPVSMFRKSLRLTAPAWEVAQVWRILGSNPGGHHSQTGFLGRDLSSLSSNLLLLKDGIITILLYRVLGRKAIAMVHIN